MEWVGRKVYVHWGPQLVVGLGLLTSSWSGFKTAAPGQATGAIMNLVEFDGSLHAGDPASLNDEGLRFGLYGRSVEQLLTYEDFWWSDEIPYEPEQLPRGFCGRRLVTTWSDELMLTIDKIVCNPERKFGLLPTPADGGIVYDVQEFDGELIERRVGRPATQTWGRSSDDIVTKSPWTTRDTELLWNAEPKHPSMAI